MDVLESIDPGLPRLKSGKVREIFEAGEHLLIVATDRISAFDCILPTLIPGKGRVLTQLSAFWFRRMADVPNHLVATKPEEFPAALRPIALATGGRAMLVRRSEPLPVEWVVRGYLAGSGWKEYLEKGSICGVNLPRDLRLADRLPRPILTPSTKADVGGGHDEAITWEEACRLCGEETAVLAREYAMRLYENGARYALERGIILADTKFEFGLADGGVILIDECLTPDSSRFWPARQWRPGVNPPSYDKQYVRDYLEQNGWNKLPPAPSLPPDVVARTAAKYEEVLELLTGIAEDGSRLEM